MIKDRKELERFEMDDIKKERFTYEEALKIFEAMWQCHLRN